MNLHFFEDYIKKMYEENKVETMFPDDKGNIRMCCPFQHSKKEFDEATWEEKEVDTDEYFIRALNIAEIIFDNLIKNE